MKPRANNLKATLDVFSLANLRDHRAIGLLREALKSRQEGVVAWGIRGLALLQVGDAVPEIVNAIDRFPAGLSWMFGMQLAIYGTPDAERALERVTNYDVLERRGTKGELLAGLRQGAAKVRDEYGKKDLARLTRRSQSSPRQ